MDGAQVDYRDPGTPYGDFVGRHSAGVEAGPRGPVERAEKKILALVAA